jgi:hypothetical protein
MKLSRSHVRQFVLCALAFGAGATMIPNLFAQYDLDEGFTTYSVLIQSGTDDVSTTSDKFIIFGQPNHTFTTATTGSDRCSQDSVNNQAISGFEGGSTAYETNIMVVDTGAGKPTRLPIAFTYGSRPSNGKLGGTLAVADSDDATCTETIGGEAMTFRRYTADFN